MRQQWKSTPMHSASKVRTLTRTVYHQLSTRCCCLTKNQQSDFSRFAPQSTSCSARCCCSGPSTCGSWVCPTSWVERRRPTCARWPATASTASCRCSSRCLGPCCSSSATSTRSEASTSHWERRWTATLSWQRGECSVLSHLTHK